MGKLLTIQEVTQITGLSDKTIRRVIDSDKLQVLPREYDYEPIRITPSALDDYVSLRESQKRQEQGSATQAEDGRITELETIIHSLQNRLSALETLRDKYNELAKRVQNLAVLSASQSSVESVQVQQWEGLEHRIALLETHSQTNVESVHPVEPTG